MHHVSLMRFIESIGLSDVVSNSPGGGRTDVEIGPPDNDALHSGDCDLFILYILSLSSPTSVGDSSMTFVSGSMTFMTR